MKPPFLSTSFSEPAKSARNRFVNIFASGRRKRGVLPFAAALVICAAAGLCAACAAGSVGIIGGADGPTAVFVTSDGENDVKALYECHTKYVGSVAGVGKVLGKIPYLRHTDGMELYTSEKPYGFGVYTYLTEISDEEYDIFKRVGAATMCLIDNCDVVRYVNRTNAEVLCETTREEWDAQLDMPLAEYAESYESFRSLYQLLFGDEIPDITDIFGQIIIEQNSGSYLSGECSGEGHIILGTEDTGESDIYYLLTTYGEYGFENGRFVKVSGTSVIPVRLTLAKDGSVREYREPVDGSYYLKSLEEMFPKEYRGIDFDSYYDTCTGQEERYARAYLASINRREAAVGVSSEERDSLYPLSDMNVEASNTLMDLYCEYPYWLGTLEQLEDGVRYVYEKSWQSRGGGDGTVTYLKYRYDNGTVAEKAVIDITGGRITCLEGRMRTKRPGT